MALQSKAETITPAIAEEMLKHDTGNFRTSEIHRVTAYASDMTNKKWELNGESIKFNGRTLIDGKHRLLAVVKSGATIKSLVVRGITTSALHIDRGKPRTLAQWLSHEKIKSSVMVAAVSRQCVAYSKGLWAMKSWDFSYITDTEIIAFAKKHHSGINKSMLTTRLPGVANSHVMTIMYIGSGYQPASENRMALWFRKGLMTGADLSDTDAVFHFRNRLLHLTIGSDKITPFMSRMLLTIAWNKTVSGTECTAAGLRLRLSGPNKQQLPKEILVAAGGS